MKLNKLFIGLALAVGMVTNISTASADGQIFRNAKEIPPPSNLSNSNYIPVPQSQSPAINNLPANFQTGGNTRTQVARLPQDSLTNASMIAQQPISLNEANLKQQTVQIDNDDTHVVPVSAANMNRISTPFRNPIVLVNGGAKYKVVGQDVYVVMESDQPIGVYIREDDNLANNSPVASLTLVPKAVPPQNISVVLENSMKERLTNPNSKIASDYTDVIRQTLGTIAQRKLPDGYSRSNVNGKTIARVGAVTLQPKVLYSGVEHNVYVYLARNVTGEYVELSEPSFWHNGVRAVAFNDGKIRLAPNDTTEIMILADVGNGEDSIHD